MITEHALLPVVPGREKEIEAAFDEAAEIISAMPGIVGLSLSRGVERPTGYLLVQWDRLEDHTEGFRRSPEHLRWRDLLHHFSEPFRRSSTSRPS